MFWCLLFCQLHEQTPVDDTHTFTLYMIGATVVSLLYPVSMFILGLRNRYLYDKLNEIAEEKEETLKQGHPDHLFPHLYPDTRYLT